MTVLIHVSSRDLGINHRNLFRGKWLFAEAAGEEKCQIFNSGLVVQRFQVVIYIEGRGYTRKTKLNAGLIKIRNIRRERRGQSFFGPMDFGEVAEASGLQCFKAEKPDKWRPSLEKAINLCRAALVDINTTFMRVTSRLGRHPASLLSISKPLWGNCITE